MTIPRIPVDCRGIRVEVGTRVRVLRISAFLERDLPPDEWTRLQAMVGEVFEVDEIDEYGQPWVSKSFPSPPGTHLGHSLALEPDEMEYVAPPRGRFRLRMRR